MTPPKSFMQMAKISPAIGFVFLAHLSLAQNSPRDYINAHNTARSQVGVGAIAWDNNLASWAQNYSNTLMASCRLVRSGGPYGENLAWSSNDISGIAAVGLWVAEKPFYDYNSNSCIGGACRHYAQVVWQNSVRLGCARISCNNGGTIISCNYDRPVSLGSTPDQAWLSRFPNGRPVLALTSLCPS